MNEIATNKTASETAKSIGAPASMFTPQSLSEAKDYAKIVADSGLVPTRYKSKPDDILVAWQMGAELGIAPMQSLQGIAVINGTPAVYGDLMLAIVQKSGLMDYHVETFSEDGKTAEFRAKRKGNPHEIIATFSEDDAKAAGLLGKAGPWTQYKKRMLTLRARAFGLRNGFADALKGMACVEEVQDYETIHTVDEKTTVVEPRRKSETVTQQKPVEQNADAKEAIFIPSKITKKDSLVFVYDGETKFFTDLESVGAIAKAAKENGKQVKVVYFPCEDNQIETIALL